MNLNANLDFGEKCVIFVLRRRRRCEISSGSSLFFVFSPCSVPAFSIFSSPDSFFSPYFCFFCSCFPMAEAVCKGLGRKWNYRKRLNFRKKISLLHCRPPCFFSCFSFFRSGMNCGCRLGYICRGIFSDSDIERPYGGASKK